MLIHLHKHATTTPKVRAAIQASDDTGTALAERFGVTPQTIYKWRKRDSVADRSHTPHRLQTTLTPAQESVAVALRRALLVSLDDLLAVVREFLNPHVSRSGLDRCLRRHGVGNLRDLTAKPTATPAPQPAPQPAPDLAPAPDPAPAPEAPKATGLLSGLSAEKQARAAQLQKMLADKARNQTSSGIDPDYIILGGELVGLYIEGGVRKFGKMLSDFAEATGLSMREAQEPMRAAYNHVRDNMDLNGEDVSDMDSGDQVMATVRKVLAAEATKPPAPKTEQRPQERDTLEQEPPAKDTQNEPDTERQDSGLDQGSLGGDQSEGEIDAGGPVGSGIGVEGSGKAGEGDAGQQGDNLDGGMVGDSADGTLDTPAERRGKNPGNFVIDPDFPLGEGTQGQKIDANLAAIRIVKALEAENRYPTKAEQAALARYVGWGGIKLVFDPRETGKTTQFGRAQADLREILTTDEYRAAARSTENAHYTSRSVVDAMWQAMRGFGFDGGRALEPTIGTGNFLGLQPEDLAGKTEWYATELDKITGQIAKHLYPDATVLADTGFQKAKFRNGTFDVAIGNRR